jgi:luciferase-like monooxygenase
MGHRTVAGRLRWLAPVRRDALRVGVDWPYRATPADPRAVRQFAIGVEALGFDHLVVPEEILETTGLQEAFVLLSYLAAVTERIELATGLVVAPSRQTLLLARQAASLHELSAGTAAGASTSRSRCCAPCSRGTGWSTRVAGIESMARPCGESSSPVPSPYGWAAIPSLR